MTTMTIGYAGDVCGCGGFKYGGHRCPPPPVPVTPEPVRLRARRDELRDVMAAVTGVYGLVPWEKQVLSRLVDAEQERITARLAELGGGDDDDA